MQSLQRDLFTGRTHYENIIIRLTEKINKIEDKPIESISIKTFYEQNNFKYK